MAIRVKGNLTEEEVKNRIRGGKTKEEHKKEIEIKEKKKFTDRKINFIVKELSKIMERWLRKDRVGSVTVNFFSGGVSSVMEKDTIRLPKWADKNGEGGEVDRTIIDGEEDK